MADLPIGTAVAGLRVDAVAGRGGMGVVYRAFDPNLQRRVALKVIAEEYAADPEFHERFRQEARSAASIEHPGVVTLHWAGEEDGRLFLVMQYVEGTDLRALITDRTRLDPVLTVDLIAQVAAALDAAHARGLVHRDVKPANVLVAGADSEPRAYLTDFGLARPIEASRQITGTGLIVGTEAYMAPELFAGGSASVRSDVYALGCVLFHCLAGRVFPRGGGASPGLAGSVGDPDLASALDAVVATALAVEPDDRFASAGALAVAARGALADARPGDTRAGAVAAPAETAAPPARTRTAAPDTAPAPAPAPDTSPNPTPPPRPVGPTYRPVPAATRPPAASRRVGEPYPHREIPVRPRPSGPMFVPPSPSTFSSLPPQPPPSSSAHPSFPSWSGPSSAGPASGTAVPTGRPRSGAVTAVVVVLSAVVGIVAGLVLVSRFVASSGGGEAASSVALTSIVDDGSDLRLAWNGPPDLDYGILVRVPGRPGSTRLVGRTTTATVPVDTGVAYCVQVRGSDGATVLTSPTEAVRGAACDAS